MPPRKPRETPAALQAFEDYWAMGDARSLPKLAAAYREKSARGEPVPTIQPAALFRWSSDHGWQERVKARILEEADLARRKLRARADKQRERIMVGLEVGMARLLQAIDKGEVVLVSDIGELATGARLYFQVAGEPLAEKTTQEHTGPDGGPMIVRAEHGTNAVLSDPGLRALAAELVARASVGASEPGEPGAADEPRAVADGAAPAPAQ